MRTTHAGNTYIRPERSLGSPVSTLGLLMLSAASLGMPAALHAQSANQTDAEVLELEAITVDGSWLGDSTEAEVRRYPGARDILSEKDLHQQGNRTLDDALRKVPSVRVEDETGTGVLPNIGIRGLNPLRSERVMMLLDGIPLALAPYTGTGLSLFPASLETIARADIVRGGGAVRFGPNNVSGVIDLISKPIPQELSGTAKQKFIVDERTGNLLSDTYFRWGGFVSPDFGLQAQVNAVTGNGGREHSGTDVLNVMVDGEWLIDDQSSLKGRLQYYDVDADLPGALSPQAYEQDPSQSTRPHDAFDAKTLRASLTYDRQIGSNGEFHWVNFAHKSDRTFDFGQPFDPDTPATDVASSPREFTVYGTEPRYTHLFHTGNASHKLVVGARYVREEVDFAVDRTNLATGSTTAARDWYFKTDAYAAYISDTVSLMNDRLEITPGLRYESVETDFSDRINNTASGNRTTELLPGLAVGFQASDSVFLFANANKSLRVPQVAQVTRGAPVSNELAWNYELGMRYEPTSDISLSAALFRIDFSDQIEFDRSSLQFQNLGETRHQGVELTAAWQPYTVPGLSLKANYTLTDTEQLSGQFTGNEVPYASDHQFNVAAEYELDSWAFGLNGHYRSAAFSDAANTQVETADGSAGPLPSAWVWNLQASKELGISNRNVRLTAAINNLFDEDYYTRGVDVSPIGRVAQPGRSFVVAVQADF